MSTNQNLTGKPHKTKSDDSVVYKVMIALVLACSAMLGMRSLCRYYTSSLGFSILYDWTTVIALSGLGLAILSALLIVVFKNRIVRAVVPWFLTAGLLVAVTGWLMRESGVNEFTFLYYLCFAPLIQYIIFQLYRWEFFLFSLSAVTAGGVFLSFSRGLYWTPKNIVMIAVLVLVLVGVTLCCRNAYRHKGCLSFGSLKVQVFHAKSTPILIYIANFLWLLCTAAIPLLGGLFSYYCMFAAIAIEFIAAVYYTFQLN